MANNVTIYDIAKACGVSPSTVSKIINGYSTIPLATRERVLETMKAMNYIPNFEARSLSKKKSHNIGVLAYFGLNISPFKHSLFTEILDSAQTYLNAKGYALLFIPHDVDGSEGTFYQSCVSHAVAGALLFGDMTNAEMREVIDSSLPCVAFDYSDEKLIGVGTNNREMMSELTEHLISLGHEDIVYIHGEESQVTNQRVKGFREALEKHGVPFSMRNLMTAKYLDVDSIKNITRSLIKSSNRPSAIIYPDDRTAITGLRAIKEEGFHCPEDISIAGFDGIEASQLVSPHLTTVAQDCQNIGAIIGKELIELLEGRAKPDILIKVRGKLVIGESTGPKKK